MNITDLRDIKAELEEFDFCGNKIIVKKYIPEAYKLYIAKNIKDIYFGENILESEPESTLSAEDLSNKNLKHTMFVVNIIKFYTDIEIEETDNLNICDLVVESGLYNTIIDIIPYSELDSLKNIINDVISEEQRRLDNENSIQNIIKTFLDKFLEKIPSDEVIDKFKNTVNDLPNLIKEANPENLKLVADIIGWNNGIKPNRQQKRKSAKENKKLDGEG